MLLNIASQPTQALGDAGLTQLRGTTIGPNKQKIYGNYY
jgi:hypothetical protein